MEHKFLDAELACRELVPLLVHNDGSKVTRESWEKRRGELLELLYVNSYGRTPPAPKEVRGEVKSVVKTAFASKATDKTVIISFDTPGGEFSFPIHIYTPNNVDNPPCFLYIKGRQGIFPDPYCPTEEIIEHGFAIIQFCHDDICRDTKGEDFDTGLNGCFRTPGSARTSEEWGRIGAWAYSCSRVMDYLVNSDDCGVDASRVALVGQSRLGKTVLWASAQDERFFMTCSNNSGFGGAAIHKKGTGERVSDFIRAGSWNWYCENFKGYLGKEDENTTYDQHMLLALTAPRHICVGSAALDRGADPKSEFLNCYAQNEVYELLGITGLVTPDRYPDPDTHLYEGNISYHLRSGSHFISRTDWLYYMDYFNRVR